MDIYIVFKYALALMIVLYCAIWAQSQAPVQLRLVGHAINDNEGRVEVYFNNIWGTVCDDDWSARDAKVVCRQLGLPYGNAIPVGDAVFGEGAGQIWLNGVSCGGSESSLAECLSPYYPWGRVSGCLHSDDAGVICTDDTTPVQVKLVGGSSNNEGRVEVYFRNTWGTVCDYGWGASDALVVCRQLGLPYGNAIAVGGAVFGEGTGQIWLRAVSCNGSESSLAECVYPNFPWGSGSLIGCSTSNDAGVICTDDTTPNQVRLVGGLNDNEGRVEVYFHNTWGTVCDFLWNAADAVVVCRQLGLPYGDAQPVRGAVFGEGTGQIWLKWVSCRGSDSSLDECVGSDNSWGSVSGCSHSRDASVICTGDDLATIPSIGRRPTTLPPTSKNVLATIPLTGSTPTPSNGRIPTPPTGRRPTATTNRTPTSSTRRTSTSLTGRPSTLTTGRKSTPSTVRTQTPSTGRTTKTILSKSAKNDTSYTTVIIAVAVCGGLGMLILMIVITFCVMKHRRNRASSDMTTAFGMTQQFQPSLQVSGDADY